VIGAILTLTWITIELKGVVSLNKRIEFKIDDQLFNFIKQYSQAEQSTMSEVLRSLLQNLKRREQRRNKTARAREVSKGQLTLF